jgi:hypothetical protein
MPLILVIHLLLLMVQLTGDEQLAIQLRPALQKHCATENHAINCIQIPLNLVQLEPFNLLHFIFLRLLLDHDCEKKNTSLVADTARLAVDFAL